MIALAPRPRGKGRGRRPARGQEPATSRAAGGSRSVLLALLLQGLAEGGLALLDVGAVTGRVDERVRSPLVEAGDLGVHAVILAVGPEEDVARQGLEHPE